MFTRIMKLGSLLGLLLCLLPQSGRAQRPGAQRRAAAESVVSVDFSECGRALPRNRAGFNADPSDMNRLLNGVWVGTRYDRSGKAHLFNYIMVYDTEAREAFIYEELDERMKENVFAKQFGPPPANAPTITYLYCGSRQLPPSKDVFVKVSDNPRLNQAEGYLGLAVSDKPLAQVWETLKESDTFTRPRGSTEINAAFYSMLVSPTQTAGRRYKDVRLDLAGQLRGNSNKAAAEHSGGKAVPGIESGVFQGVRTGTGNYLVSAPYAADCYGPSRPLARLEPNLPPMTNFRYSKVVIGPVGQ